MTDLMTDWDEADAELVKTEDGVRWLLSRAWAEGHDAARTYYAGGPKEPNPYSTQK